MSDPIVLPPVTQGRADKLPALLRYLSEFHPNKPVRVTIEIARPDKTPAQNRYLWAVPYKMISQATGFEAEDLHEWNCGAQWGWKDKPVPKTPRNPTGFESVPVRTTTRNADGEPEKCSMEELTELWERMQRRGVSLEIFIPDPDPDYYKAAK